MKVPKKLKNLVPKEDDFSVELYLSMDGPNKGKICFIDRNGVEKIVSKDEQQSSYDSLVFFDKDTPTTVDVVFDPNTPATRDILYVSQTNQSTWLWKGTSYEKEPITVPSNTPFNIAGTNIDLGNSKSIAGERSGEIRIKNSSSASIRTISGTKEIRILSTSATFNKIQSSGGDFYLTAQDAYNLYFSTTNAERIRILSTGAIRFNQAYTFPTSDGTANQALVTNGSGVLSFSTVSSGGIWGIANSSGVYTYYATLTLAMASATAGQTIELFSDITETGNVSVILKNGVKINGNGHTYNYTNTAGDCFVDGGSNIVVDISDLYVTRTSATTTGKVWYFTGANSKVEFFGGKTTMTIGSGSFTVARFECLLMKGLNSVAVGDGCAIYFFSVGSMYNCYGEGTLSTSFAILCYAGYAESVTGRCGSSGRGILTSAGLYVGLIGFSSSGNGIETAAGALTNNMYGQSTSGSGIANYGTMNNSVGYSTTNSGISGGGTGMNYNCEGISSSGYGIDNMLGHYNGVAISQTNYGAYVSNVYNSTVITNGSAYAVALNTNQILINSTSINNWNNAGGHSVVASNGSVVTNNYLKVTNASANCIYSSVAITVKYSENTMNSATTSVNANITQGISNTVDSQGNITL